MKVAKQITQQILAATKPKKSKKAYAIPKSLKTKLEYFSPEKRSKWDKDIRVLEKKVNSGRSKSFEQACIRISKKGATKTKALIPQVEDEIKVIRQRDKKVADLINEHLSIVKKYMKAYKKTKNFEHMIPIVLRAIFTNMKKVK